MIKKILFTLLFISFTHLIFSQDKSTGFWTGTMDREGSIMNVSFEFIKKDKLFTGYFNSPSQKASGIPLDSVSASNDSLKFQLMSEPVTKFKCIVSNDSITGYFTQEGFSKGSIILRKTRPPVKNYGSIDTSFNSGEIHIACRIYIPETGDKHPAVIFMQGSGAEGMFANQYFAEYLASKGIVTVIQDKRGVNKSTGDWQTAGFSDLASDHINAVKFLKTFDKVNPEQIGIFGHSQGGTIAPLAASGSKDIAFVIAAAGIGDTIYKQDLYRIQNSLLENGFSQNEVKTAMSYFKSWLDIARTGLGFEKLNSLNQKVKNKKWIDLVAAPPRDHWLWKFYLNIGNFYPPDYWKLVSVPVLLVYGEDDEIEDVRSYLQNIDHALIDLNRNNDVTQVILPKAQHNLCISPGKNEKFFWWHLSPGFEDLLAGWILYRFKY